MAETQARPSKEMVSFRAGPGSLRYYEKVRDMVTARGGRRPDQTAVIKAMTAVCASSENVTSAIVAKLFSEQSF